MRTQEIARLLLLKKSKGYTPSYCSAFATLAFIPAHVTGVLFHP
jgi:hypothetical protein